MPRSTAFDRRTVFVKTAKGREEVAKRGGELTPRQRQTLILIDGNRDFGTMMAMMPLPQLHEIISFLVDNDLIQCSSDVLKRSGQDPKQIEPVAALRVEAALRAEPIARIDALQRIVTEPAPEKTRSRLTQDQALIRQVKDFMTTTTQTYLGLLGADVIRRIERAKDAAQLMSVMGHWHMALRDSKHGGRFAAPYLAQVEKSLTEEFPEEALEEATAQPAPSGSYWF